MVGADWKAGYVMTLYEAIKINEKYFLSFQKAIVSTDMHSYS
jgi:hypothetical protein